MATKIRDHTGLIPFMLFGLFAAIVGWAIWRGTHPRTDNDDTASAKL